MSKNRLVMPVLKWVGGKRQLLPEIQRYLPKRKFGTYYEPFIGGGAVFFHLQPQNAVINDLNSELINLYRVIKDNSDELIAELKTYKNEEEFYYTLRGLDRSCEYSSFSNIKKAARIHYLNKTCFNGLYRVNSIGEFNSPYGKYSNPNIVNEITINAVSKYFNSFNISILNEDYQKVLKTAKKGDFVYFDPPYDPISDSSNFTGYTKGGFDREEQIRLKQTCDDLTNKKVDFLLSNSNTSFIRDLFKDFTIVTVGAKRSINSNGTKRGEVEELLIYNYKETREKTLF